MCVWPSPHVTAKLRDEGSPTLLGPAPEGGAGHALGPIGHRRAAWWLVVVVAGEVRGRAGLPRSRLP